MAELFFKVQADVDKVIQLRNEIEKLKTSLSGMNRNIDPSGVAAMESKLQSAQTQMNGMVSSAAKAGEAVGHDLKVKIYEAANAIADIRQKILNQRAVIKEAEMNMRKLGEAYRSSLKSDPASSASRLAEFNSAKNALYEEKYALFSLTQEQAKARISASRLRNEQNLLKDSNNEVSVSFADLGTRIKGMLATAGIGFGLKELAKQIVNVRGQFQDLEVSFKTLLGSGDKASALMDQLVKTAAHTPFDLQGVAAAANQLLAYGEDVGKVNDDIIRLGNIASGLNLNMGDMAYLYGTTMVQGRLYARDLLQFTSRGIPLTQELAKQFGVGTDEVSKLVSAGKVGFPEVQKAIENMTNEGGKFYNLMEEKSKTVNGRISNIGDQISKTMNDIGKSSEGVINGSLASVEYLLDNLESLGKIITGLVATYGTYKAAILLTTSSVKGLTIAETVGMNIKKLWTSVTKVAAAAQALLNRTVLANPYVAAAVALGALVTALWAASDGLSATEKAQEVMNKKMEAAKEAQDKYNSETEEAIRLASDDASASADRKKGMDTLIARYPDIIKKYIDEEGHLRDILGMKRAIAAFEGNKSVAQNINDSKTDAKYAKLARSKDAIKVQKARHQYLSETGEYFTLKTDNELAEYFEKKSLGAKYNAARMVTIGKVDKNIASIPKLKKEDKAKRKKFYADIKKKYGGKKVSVYDPYIKDYISSSDIDKLDATYNGTYKSAPKDTAKDKSNLSDGRLAGSKADNREELIKRDLKQEQDAALEKSDLKFQIEQTSINENKNAAERERKQSELDHKKRLDQIDRQAQDYKNKNIENAASRYDLKNPKDKGGYYIKGLYKNASLTKDQQNMVKARIDSENAEWERMQQEENSRNTKALNDYLKQYGDYQEKRKAIAEDYDRQISDASADGQKKTIEKEKEQALGALDFSEFQNAINWDAVFGNLDAVSSKAMALLENQLMAVKEKIYGKGSLSADDLTQLKTLQDAVDKIESVRIDRNPFKSLDSGVEKYKKSLESLKKAEDDMSKVNAVQYSSTENIGDAWDNAIRSQDSAMIAAIENTSVTIEETDAEGKAVQKTMTFVEWLKKLQKQQSDTSNSGKELGNSLKGIGGKMSQIAQIGKSAEELGKKIGVEIPASIGKTIDGLGETGEAMESFDLSKPGSLANINNYIKVVSGLVDTFSGLGETVGSIFGFGGSGSKWQKEYNSAVQKYSALRSVWDDLIDRKKEYLNISWGEEAKQTQEEIISLQKAENTSIQTEAKAYLQTKEGHHGSSHTNYTWMNREFTTKGGMSGYNWDLFNDIEQGLSNAGLGDDNSASITGVQDFFNLNADQLTWIKTNYAENWASMSETFQNYLEDYISGLDAIEKTQQDFADKYTGTIDDMASSLYDLASDTDATISKVQSSWNEGWNTNIWKQLTTEGSDFYKAMEAYQQHYNDAVASDSGLTPDEAAALRKEYESIYSDVNAKYDAIVSESGTEDTSGEQSATVNSIKNITADQADQIVSRMTAIEIAVERGNAQRDTSENGITLLNATVPELLASAKVHVSIADDIRTMAANSYLELQGINSNTGLSAKYLAKMETDLADMYKVIKDKL